MQRFLIIEVGNPNPDSDILPKLNAHPCKRQEV